MSRQQNVSHDRFLYMRGQFLFSQTQPFGNALHAFPRSRIYGRLISTSIRRGASAVLAIRRLNRPEASPSPLSPFSTFFLACTRPYLSAQPTHSRSDLRRPFSNTSSAMTAKKIDGTAIAKAIRERLCAEIEKAQKTNPRFKPSLRIVQGKSLVRVWLLGAY